MSSSLWRTVVHLAAPSKPDTVARDAVAAIVILRPLGYGYKRPRLLLPTNRRQAALRPCLRSNLAAVAGALAYGAPRKRRCSESQPRITVALARGLCDTSLSQARPHVSLRAVSQAEASLVEAVPLVSAPLAKGVRLGPSAEFHVAPMIGVTDQHFRFLLRLLSSSATLWTEMIRAEKLLACSPAGQRQLLDYDPAEHPVVLQLASSDPEQLGRAARLAAPWGYDEINLNCGCPSMLAGQLSYGAHLMLDPPRAAAAAAALVKASAECAARGGSSPRVSVKCRTATYESRMVEGQTGKEAEYEALRRFAVGLQEVGVRRLYVHARSAILGFSTVGNRVAPPLRHDSVLRLAQEMPDLEIVANGGVCSPTHAAQICAPPLRGVMAGRAVRDKPWLWSCLDRDWFGLPCSGSLRSRREILEAYLAYAATCGAAVWGDEAERLRLVEPLLPLFSGEQGGEEWRQCLSRGARGAVDLATLRAVVLKASSRLDAEVLDVRGVGGASDAPTHPRLFHVHASVALRPQMLGGPPLVAAAQRPIAKGELLLGVSPAGLSPDEAYGLVSRRPNCSITCVPTDGRAREVSSKLPPGAPAIVQWSRLIFARSDIAAGETLSVARAPAGFLVAPLLVPSF